MFDALWQDLRYGVRALRRSPGFAVAAILSLALGIGANTAIFSAIDALILESLPVRHPEELFQIMQGKQSYEAFSNPTWEHLRDRQDVFSGIFAYGRWDFNLAAGGEARLMNGQYVSGQYFNTLGIGAALGRTLTTDDDTRGCAGAAVLSDGFWRKEYGSRADILGKTISIDRHPIEIVGVAERGFSGTEVGGPADVIVPLCAATLIRGGDKAMLDPVYLPTGFLQVIGRLKRGVSQNQALARLKTLAPEIYKATLDDQGDGRKDAAHWHAEDRDRYLKRTFDIEPAANGISYLRRQYRQALMILMAIAGAVLLIACANVANLLLARGAAREREIAIRMAMGSGRGRLIRQLLTESLLLSGLGAMLGVPLAEWSLRLLVRFLDASLDLSLDSRVLAFTAAVSVLAALLFGIAPAWRGARVQPQAAMKANGVRGSKLRLGKVLAMAQLALSLPLVTGAGLLLATFWTLAYSDAGFERDHVLLVTADLRSANYPVERWSAAYREMLDRLRMVPGVRSASLSEITPVCHCRWSIELAVEGYAPKSRDDATASYNSVSDRYFETIGTPMIAGRDFNDHDTAASIRVAIVSQSMARKYFGATNPIGKNFRIREGNAVSGPIEIVGLVGDAKYSSLRDERPPFVFIPWRQSGVPGALTAFQLRSAGGAPNSLIPGVKSAVGRIDPNVSIAFKTLDAQVNRSIERETALAALSGFFAALALLLATVGLYGVVSYNMVLRRGEIGIRMALGADPSRVLRMALGEIAISIGIGLAVGLGTALATTRLIASFLYGLQPNDPWTLGGAAALLAMAAAIAGYLPARRASRLDPMAALREDSL